MRELSIAVSLIALWCLSSIVLRWRTNSVQRARIREAEGVLARHGMQAGSYMPDVGADDMELRHALEVIAGSGRIVLDRRGNVVGHLKPKAVAKKSPDTSDNWALMKIERVEEGKSPQGYECTEVAFSVIGTATNDEVLAAIGEVADDAFNVVYYGAPATGQFATIDWAPEVGKIVVIPTKLPHN